MAVAHETLALAGVGEARDGEREKTLPETFPLITEKARGRYRPPTHRHVGPEIFPFRVPHVIE